MAYRFRVSEPLCDGVRRVTGEQLSKSIQNLTSPDVPQPVAVHEFRKSCKKIRSVLRLVRPALGERYQAENQWYRDIARELSRVRDAEVLVQTVEGLQTECSSKRMGSVLGELRDRLDQRRRQTTEDWVGLNQLLPKLAEQVQVASSRIAEWKLSETSFALIGPGLKEIYRKGRKAYRRALADPTEERWHDWRKRAKDHGYHTRLLQGAWPVVMGARSRELSLLGDLLGEEHDLAVLLHTLKEEPAIRPSDADMDRLTRRVAARQRQLLRKARRLGALVYSESPDSLVGRLEAYWQARGGRVT